MSFVTDLVIQQGMKQLPTVIEAIAKRLKEGECILLVPADKNLVAVIAKFNPRVDKINDDDTYNVSLENCDNCKKYILPDDIELMLNHFKNE